MVKIGYVRVSREKQDPASQIKLMKDMGILDVDIFVDHGYSGWSDPTSRPVYKQMITRLDDPTKEKVDTVVFSEFSRIGRNAKESLYELLRLEHNGYTVQSLSKAESFINDIPATFQATILAGMMAGADLERQHHKERTKWALEHVKSHGSKSGKKIGRPRVKINFDKVKSIMEQYNVSENVARKICGYDASTFYKHKRLKKEEEENKTKDTPEKD